MPKRNVTIYGLATCETTRNARKWLAARGIDHAYADVRDDGLTKAKVDAWLKALGWEKVLNKASTTWRGLQEKEKAAVVDAKSAAALMLRYPALVKRPVLDVDGKLTLGFKPATYEEIFGK